MLSPREESPFSDDFNGLLHQAMGDIFQRADYWSLSAASKEHQLGVSKHLSLGDRAFNRVTLQLGQTTLTNLLSCTAQRDLPPYLHLDSLPKYAVDPYCSWEQGSRCCYIASPMCLAWCGTINHIKHELYGPQNLALPRVIGLTTLLDKNISYGQVSSGYKALEISISQSVDTRKAFWKV